MNLKDCFDALDEELKLDPAVRLRAEGVHNKLGTLLVDAGVAKRTRLQGSFARHTMRGPELHDIDKIVELADASYDALAGPGGPREALSAIHRVLAPRLGGARFEFKKHALAVTLPGDGFNFDAVPAFNPEDDTKTIHIADTDSDRWEPSNTYVLIDTISARNQECNGRFVRQVRMVKHAVHQAGLSDLIPGLHIESFAYAAVDAAVEHAQAVAATLRAGARLLGGAYTDPTGTDPISSRLDQADIAIAKQAMQRLAELADSAQRSAAAGNETAAANTWVDMFGRIFPRPANSEQRFLQHLHADNRTPPTRAWRPHHGRRP